MVSDDGSRDRGQLILIGAVAIAFILLGIVVVFNSVLYTQTIASGGTVESGVDAQTTELELERETGELAQAVARNFDTTEPDDSDKLEDDIESALEEFATQYEETKAEANPTIVTVDEASMNISEWGWMVSQGSVTEFANSDDDDDDYDRRVFGNDTASATPNRELDRLTMTIHVESIEEGKLDVVLQDASDAENELEFEYEGDDDDDDAPLEIDRDDDDDDAECELVPREDGTVQVNLLDGTAKAASTDGECDSALNLTQGLGDRYTLLAFDGDDDDDGGLQGTYEIVVGNQEGTDIPDPDHFVARTIELKYNYETPEISFTRELEVDVYGGDP